MNTIKHMLNMLDNYQEGNVNYEDVFNIIKNTSGLSEDEIRKFLYEIKRDNIIKFSEFKKFKKF